VTDPYSGREQTKAKHFILKRYLQALAFKVLRFYDITYVDGFSGPWETKTEDFLDSSFMIAISVLKDAQQKIQIQTGRRPKIRCFFSENNRQAYTKLATALSRPFTNPKKILRLGPTAGNSKMRYPRYKPSSAVLSLSSLSTRLGGQAIPSTR
jgi:three-Cys-motif partner protein